MPFLMDRSIVDFKSVYYKAKVMLKTFTLWIIDSPSFEIDLTPSFKVRNSPLCWAGFGDGCYLLTLEYIKLTIPLLLDQP